NAAAPTNDQCATAGLRRVGSGSRSSLDIAEVEIAKQHASRDRTRIAAENTEAVGRAARIRIALDRYDAIAAHLDHKPSVAFAATKIQMEDHARFHGLCIRFRFPHYLCFGVEAQMPERDHTGRLGQRILRALDLRGLLEHPIEEADAPWKTVLGRIEPRGANVDVDFGAAIGAARLLDHAALGCRNIDSQIAHRCMGIDRLSAEDGARSKESSARGWAYLTIDRQRLSVGRGVSCLEVEDGVLRRLAEVAVNDERPEAEVVQSGLQRPHVIRAELAAMQRPSTKGRDAGKSGLGWAGSGPLAGSGLTGLGWSLTEWDPAEVSQLVVNRVGIDIIVEIAKARDRQRLENIPAARGLELRRAAKAARLRKPGQLHKPGIEKTLAHRA